MVRVKSGICGVAAVLFFVGSASADTINFETGFTDGQVVNAFTTVSNVLTVDATSGRDVFIAEVGKPTTGFHPKDTPGKGGDAIGVYFLTDGVKGKPKKTNFEFSFDTAVDQFSLNIIDLGIKGRSAVLKACKDAACNEVVDETTFTVGKTNTKGLVGFLDLGTFAPVNYFLLEFYSKNGKRTPVDPGIGLDNFTFRTHGGGGPGPGPGPEIPEPATVALLGSALVGAGLKRKLKKD